MALGHDGLLHEVLGLLANLFPGCPEAQRAFCSGAAPPLLQRCLDLICKPSLDLPTLEVCCCLAAPAVTKASHQGNILLLLRYQAAARHA